MRIACLRTGGQTGVDRGVLDYAVAHQIAYSGWCPRGGWAEDYPNPPGVLAHYPLLSETPSADTAQRTAWNVRDSHATLILSRAAELENSSGTVFTRQAAELIFLRPCRAVDVDRSDAADDVRTWLDRVASSLNSQALVLNIAGPRESRAGGIRDATLTFLAELLQPFALWLIPCEQDQENLSSIISELARGHGAPPFAPHLTLCSGNIAVAGSPEDLSDRLDRLCVQLRSIATNFVRIEQTDHYFTFFYARLDEGGAGATAKLQSRIGSALNVPGRPEIGLHLSLMYGAPGEQIDRVQLAQSVMPRLPSRVVFDRVQLVIPVRGQWRDVANWQVVHTAKLGR
jgi:hypothetical protein